MQIIIKTNSYNFLQFFTNLYKFLHFLKIFWQILVHSNSFLKFITNSYQFKYFLTISDNFWPILTNFNICLQSLILSYNFLLFLTISFLMNSYKFLNSSKFLQLLVIFTISNKFLQNCKISKDPYNFIQILTFFFTNFNKFF